MDKTSVRKNDRLEMAASTQPRQFSRVSSRIFCMDGEWFFQTRDNDHGPFTKREAAEQALEKFVAGKHREENSLKEIPLNEERAEKGTFAINLLAV